MLTGNDAIGTLWCSRAELTERVPSRAGVTRMYRVNHLEMYLKQSLVQICIEEQRQTLYVVRMHKVGHFIRSTN